MRNLFVVLGPRMLGWSGALAFCSSCSGGSAVLDPGASYDPWSNSGYFFLEESPLDVGPLADGGYLRYTSTDYSVEANMQLLVHLDHLAPGRELTRTRGGPIMARFEVQGNAGKNDFAGCRVDSEDAILPEGFAPEEPCPSWTNCVRVGQKVTQYLGDRSCLDLISRAYDLAIDDTSASDGSWQGAPELMVTLNPQRGLAVASPNTWEQRLQPKSIGYDGPWTAVASASAPPELAGAEAFAVGEHRVLLAGRTLAGAFVAFYYDLENDAWTVAEPDGMPQPKGSYKALWTGSQLLVVTSGGGAALDVGTGKWTSFKTEGAPVFDLEGGRGAFVAVHRERKLYVFGAAGSGVPGTAVTPLGAVYDLETEAWTSIAMDGAPNTAAYSEALWTDMGILVWADGLIVYHPSTGYWRGTGIDRPFDATLGAAAFDAHLVPTATGAMVVPYQLKASADADSYLPGVRQLDVTTMKWGGENSVGFVPASKGTPKVVGPWMLVYGGAQRIGQSEADSFVEINKGGLMFHVDARRYLELPFSITAPTPRLDAALTLVGDSLFVWGGCRLQYMDGACAAYHRDGAWVRLLVPAIAP